MTRQIVECVPNFSEGRDVAKVEAISDAMSMPGVYVLDRQMDADHNRSVITIAGSPQAILEAAIRGVGKAAELINLTHHHGVHPRMGATDVVPFVPIEGVTLSDCAALARQAGAEIFRRFKIPVYLYEEAATLPARSNLANVRRGGFEVIHDEIANNPARMPDFGEPRVHPTAGITAVGARKFLIAYNIFLNTADVSIAKKVAKAVRYSSGGLPGVKALGLLVRGMAQVSMNLVDFEQTSIQQAFDAVSNEAGSHGTVPLASEIIGLIPARALAGTSPSQILLHDFDPSKIFENRLKSVIAAQAL